MAMTALHAAARDGDHAAVEALLAQEHTEVDALNEKGTTALHFACHGGHVAVARRLLEAGARVDVMNNVGASALHYAALRGEADLVDLLVGKGADLEAKSKNGQTVLFKAALNGRRAAVQRLLDCGADVHASDSLGWTPLHGASHVGDAAIVELLVARGADVNTRTKDGRTVLHVAASNGSTQVLEYVIRIIQATSAAEEDSQVASRHPGAVSVAAEVLSLESRDANGRTALFEAALNGKQDAVQCLLDHKADVDAMSDPGWAPLHAAAHCADLAIVALLVSRGADLQNGRSALHVAALNGSNDVVKYFVDQGLDANTVDKAGWSVLHCAIEKCEIRVLEFLVKCGADLNLLTDDQASVMALAANFGRKDVVDWLLSKELKFDATDENGWTPVHRAVQAGSVETIERLLETGANIHARTKDGKSALVLAAERGNVDMIKFLIANGVDVNAANKTGWSPLLAAALVGSVEAVELLLESGANIHATLETGHTALHIAAQRAHVAVVQLLLRSGSDAKATTKDGCWSTVHYAAFGGSVDILQFLVEGGADVFSIANDGSAALHSAVQKGHRPAATYLLEQGLDVNATDADGRTALHYVCDTGDSHCTSLLLEAGATATIDLADKDGYRVIHFTARAHLEDETRELLKAGADVHVLTEARESPLDLAVYSPSSSFALATVRVLCSYGAEWTASSHDKLVALRAEIESRSTSADDELAKQLLWCEGMRACVLHWEQQRRGLAQELNEIPIEVIQRGEASVMTYLADMTATSGAEAIYRTKVCVVGPSEWGKSSLVRSIEAMKPFLMNIEDRTIGIDLVSSYFSESMQIDEETKDLLMDDAPPPARVKHHQVTFWDFAGQDVYQVAHALFFSRRTQYVLVVDVDAYKNQLEKVQSLRLNQAEAEMNRFLSTHVFRWVHTIFSRQTDATFLIFGTKVDLLKNENVDCDHVWRDLKNRIYRWKENYISELNGAVDGAAAKMSMTVRKPGGNNDARGVHIRELKQKLDRLASDKWLVVSVTRRESILAVRAALQEAIASSKRGFPMGSTYSRVLEIITKKRESAKRPGDGQHRLEYSIVSVTRLCRQLMDEIEDLEVDDCYAILRTLHDLGDIIWYDNHGLGRWSEYVILDPLLVLDVVREVINHEYTHANSDVDSTQDGGKDTVRFDGFMAHDLLKTFPLWKDMDDDFMGEFKLLLNHFQLAYSAVDSVMLPESDLIVPTYWKAMNSTESRARQDPEVPQDGVVNIARAWTHAHCWEYLVSGDVSGTVFDQFAVESHSPSIKRDVRANGFKSIGEEFQVQVTLVPSDTFRDTLRIEVNADDADDAWCNMRFYLMHLEKVLGAYPGLTVSRYVLQDGKQHKLADIVKAYEDTIRMGKNPEDLRAKYRWMPPDLDWFVARAWSDIGKFKDLQLAQQMRQRLAVIERLVITGDAQRRYPALWSLECKTERRVVVLRMLSDLSGKCFHVPLEIRVPPAFLATHRSKLKEGVSLMANVVSSALSVPVLRTAIEGVASRLDTTTQHAAKIHGLIERLDLSTVSDRAIQTPATMGLSPKGAMAVLKDLLALYNDSADELSISEICNLDCAVTRDGHYVWAHASEIRTVKDLKPCQPEKERSPPALSAASIKSRSTTESSLQLFLCIETVTGLPERDWYKTYCTWQLLYGEGKTPLASGATTQNPESSSEPSWGSATTALDAVGLVEMLRKCRLAVQVKRRSRFGYTRFIGEGEVVLRPLVAHDAKPNFHCDPVNVTLQASGSSASVTTPANVVPRVVKCHITAHKEAPLELS